MAVPTRFNPVVGVRVGRVVVIAFSREFFAKELKNLALLPPTKPPKPAPITELKLIFPQGLVNFCPIKLEDAPTIPLTIAPPKPGNPPTIPPVPIPIAVFITTSLKEPSCAIVPNKAPVPLINAPAIAPGTKNNPSGSTKLTGLFWTIIPLIDIFQL